MNQEKILEMIEIPTSVSELARALGVNQIELGGYLKGLESAGLIKKIQVGKSHVYVKIVSGGE